MNSNKFFNNKKPVYTVNRKVLKHVTFDEKKTIF